MRKPLFEVIADDRILILITSIAFFWRAFISRDREIVLWEGVCSGISLLILGWALFGYIYSMSQKPTRWPVANRIYHGLGFSLLVLNVYVLIYYGMRWFKLLHVEVFPHLDFILSGARYVMFVMFYCAIIWSAKYLKAMQEDYRFLVSRSKMRGSGLRETVSRVITDERTLLVMIGVAFLWRTVISFDYNITFWESTCQYIIQLIIGWYLFGYLCALSVKARAKLELSKVSQGLAVALCTINVYALVYYGINWYSLIGVGDFDKSFAPMDFLFSDVRFFALVIFYYTVIVSSKFLEKASMDYTVPIKKQSGT